MGIIDEVKQKIDIVEVISQYTTLRKAGRNLTALCPFHSEKHPSFFVYPEQQTWHCFGACSTGGDVFAFIMKKEGLSFGEALRMLAQRAGVSLPAKIAPAAKEEHEELYRVNEAAAMYYHNLLLTSTAAAKARDYLARRGISPQAVGDFQLGYSTEGWEALKGYLLARGYAEELMVRAGLLVKAEDGHTYDRFRGKLMIPIRDIRGRVTGFGARVLDDSLPKYVNSPQTAVFDKGGSLYGIDRAAAAIRQHDRALIMEGYMDVIMAHQCGVGNAVACMGTAVTEAQVNTLKKLSRNIILCLDADAAGEEAMLRTVGYEAALGGEIRVIVLPPGKDPDEVMREDIGRWQNLVDASIPLVDFMFERVVFRLDLDTARGKSLAVERLLPVVAQISEPIRQAHYLQKLAGLVRVDMDTIKAALSRQLSVHTRHRAEIAKPQVPTALAGRTTSREEYLLALILQHPELARRLDEVSVELFESTENREVFRTFKELGDVVLLKERVDPLIRDHLEALLGKSLPGAGNNIDLKFEDCLYKLEEAHLKNLAARQAETGEIAVEVTRRLKELEAKMAQRRKLAYRERMR